jgi:hypothetical protein
MNYKSLWPGSSNQNMVFAEDYFCVEKYTMLIWCNVGRAISNKKISIMKKWSRQDYYYFVNALISTALYRCGFDLIEDSADVTIQSEMTKTKSGFVNKALLWG